MNWSGDDSQCLKYLNIFYEKFFVKKFFSKKLMKFNDYESEMSQCGRILN